MNVSVIIPSYNRAHVLPRAIDSVLSQHLTRFDAKNPKPQAAIANIELIVVDDGSDDGTQELIARNYPDIRLLTQENQGVSAARNAGLAAASGEWIAFLDSDDVWLPNKLQRQWSQIQKTQRLICHTEEIWIRNGVRVNQRKKHQKRGGWIYQYCLPLCVMSPSSIVLHRKVFAQCGEFDELLPACEDYDLWLRIAACYEIAYVEQPCIEKYGGHEDQLSRKHWGMDRFRIIALEKILNSGKLDTRQMEMTRAMLLKKNHILRMGAVKRENADLITVCDERQRQWGGN